MTNSDSTHWPRITVVTPSFRQAQFLEATILSVLGQFYPNLEYIIMDGGSEDGSVEIIERYASQLAYWQSGPDGGQSEAVNQGFARATGDIFCWVNSDDFLLPGVLHEVARLLREEGGLIYGDCLSFSEKGTRARVNRPPAHDQEQLKIVDYVVQPSAFWTRALWEKAGPLNEELYYAFDWEWFLRASKIGPMRKVDRIFSAYRFHDAHKTSFGGVKRATEIVRVAEIHAGENIARHYQFAMKHADVLGKYENWVLRIQGRGLHRYAHLASLATPLLRMLPAGLDLETLRACHRMLGIR